MHELRGASPPQPPPGALKRAPGPHAVMGERSARFARYASQLFPFFSQQPSGISDIIMFFLSTGGSYYIMLCNFDHQLWETCLYMDMQNGKYIFLCPDTITEVKRTNFVFSWPLCNVIAATGILTVTIGGHLYSKVDMMFVHWKVFFLSRLNLIQEET